MVFRLDLHIHSKYSFDSISEPAMIVKTAIRKKLDAIAITDHNTIRGGIEAVTCNKNHNLYVIVGAEILTDIGDIIGLFLYKEINSRHWKEVIGEIYEQGGIVILPHPFKSHNEAVLGEVAKRVDLIEIFNSRCTSWQNEKALHLAKTYKKSICVNTDAHSLSEIGLAYTTVNTKEISNIYNFKLTLQQDTGYLKAGCQKYTPKILKYKSRIIKLVKIHE